MKKLVIFLTSGAVIAALAVLLFAQNPQTATPTQPNSNNAPYLNCPWYNGNTDTMMQQNMMGRGMMGNGMMGRGMGQRFGQMHGNMMQNNTGMMNAGRMNSAMMTPNANGPFCPWDTAEFKAWQQQNKVSAPLNKDTAKRWAENYLHAYNSPDLVLGKIVEKNNGFEVEIRNKKTNKVREKIFVDKHTGWISQVQN